jgi:hypothetical protein
MTSQKINDGEVIVQRVEPLLGLFACLVSLREELRARTLLQKRQRKLQRYADKSGFILIRNDDGRDFRLLKRHRPYNAAEVPLPIYVERSPRSGNLFFRSCPGSRKRVPLPSDPTTAEFNRAYHAALLDAGENNDLDDWSELRAFHAAQLEEKHKAQPRGTGGQR